MTRLPWHEVGVFNRDTRSYSVERIPKPPEARAIFEEDFHGRASIVGHELKVGCQKCFAQIIVRWQRAYSDNLVRDFIDDRNPEIMALAVAQEMQKATQRAEAEMNAARRREAEARQLAEAAELRFKRIQVKRSKQRKKKERKQRARGKGR